MTQTSAATLAISITSTPSIDDERYSPGTLIADRYRIHGRLGKGGMGEVYRAIDMRLGQTVALKFLPETTARDPAMLVRFYNEVRIARQVTHPNVCRVFDIGEVNGQPFISMQFVDGEDLASLLRRIGRLPADKAVEMSRRLCAGLAAAHSQGVLHRDLKPANVMIDGRGQVIITDFGLAGLEHEIRGADIHSGTPAYMSPEQLEGKEVSTRSDIYALGLVMYEMFTGRRAFEAETLAELIRLRGESRPSEMSSAAGDIDPAVERIILRCLDPDPLKRPASPLAVSAALPGGDPLAAALAAGETPSPEMVAAAGSQEGMRPVLAITSLAVVLVALVANVLLYSRQELASNVNLELPPEALAVQARKIVQQFGYTHLIVDQAFTFDYNGSYLKFLSEHSKTALDWDQIGRGQPPPVYFSYRESPVRLEPTSFFGLGRVTASDPPTNISGMAHVVLDLNGRLIGFSAVPPQLDKSAASAPSPDPAPIFAAAGLDPKAFHPVTPEWTPLAPIDSRAAWTGTVTGNTNPVRLEAAWWRGKPVFFAMVWPWTFPGRMPSHPSGWQENYTWAALTVIGTVFAALIAWRNLRLGRGDRKGAFRLAAFAFTAAIAQFFLRTHYAMSAWFVYVSIEAVGEALWVAALLWLGYIALEPLVRKLWPRSLISSTRLLSGRWRDPLVGRDILIGLAVGMGYDLIFAASNAITLRMGSTPSTGIKLDSLLGVAPSLYVVCQRVTDGLLGTFLYFLLFFLLRTFLRREWLAGLVFVALFVGLRVPTADYPWVNLPAIGIVYIVVVIMLARCGLLALVTTIFVTDLLVELVFTTRFSAWYATSTLVLIAVVAGLAIYAFRLALGGQKLTGAFLES